MQRWLLAGITRTADRAIERSLSAGNIRQEWRQ
jgi:hypothetical protein